MDINFMLDKAIQELAQLNVGELFTVKDLFKGYEWNRIKQGDRSTLGTLFLNYAKANKQILIHNTGSGQKKYSLKYK